MVTILDGKRVAAEVRAEVAVAVTRLRERGVVPSLAVVLVGEDPASQVYVRNKDRAAAEAGFAVQTLRLPASISQSELEAEVARLCSDASVHGILVQLPLPQGLSAERVLDRLDPAKDVDGLTPANVAALVLGREGLVPCTPAGCIELCDRYGIELAGKHLVVLGRSQLVGKPLALLALARHATVTICHSKTADLAAHCARADILVAAIGRPRLVRGEWIRSGAVVLDVGINRLPDGTLAGDVDFASASERASAITPVPGGIGPMTIAMLLASTARAAARQVGLGGGAEMLSASRRAPARADI